MIRDYDIPITIAGILVNVRSKTSPANLRIEERFGPFFGVPDHPFAVVSLGREEVTSGPAPLGALIYDPKANWRMHRSDQIYSAVITTQDEKGIATRDCVLRANAQWDDVTLIEQPASSDWPSNLSFGASELLLRTKILLTDGLFFHAAGIDDNGRGIIFIGHSGAGKSTLAAMWSGLSGVTAMNDDRMAVRLIDGGAMCYGTPWPGSDGIARNHASPLTAIVLPEQAENNAIQLVSVNAAPILLARTFMPWWDSSLIQRALSNITMLLARVPMYRLRFRRDPGVIDVVRSVL